jgi:hypothetical protein
MKTRGGTVPIVISYRRVSEKPKIKRTRRFVGFANVLRNVAVKAIEFVEEMCYETESEVLDAGKQQVVHWALEVDDPWGVNDESSLVAVRTLDKPACGVHCEIITTVEWQEDGVTEKTEEEAEEEEDEEEEVEDIAPPKPAPKRVNNHAARRRRRVPNGPSQEAIRAMMRERIRKEGRQ